MCIEKVFFVLVVLLFLFCLVDVLRAEEPEPTLLGKTQPSSQSNRPLLSGSESTSATWSELYRQGQEIYEKQRSDLEALNKEISSLRTGYSELTILSERLSRSNEDLSRYNSQIAERMQERDLDLYNAYEELDAKDLTIAKKNTAIWKLIVAVVVMGAVIIGAAILAIMKFYFKKKIPLLGI